MKRRLLALAALFFATSAVAQNEAEARHSLFPITLTNAFTLSAQETLGEQVVYANEITLNGQASDDLFLIALASKPDTGVIRLGGSAAGTVWAIGQTQTDITGPVERHLRAAGGPLRVDSRIGGNMWALSTFVTLDTNATVAGSVYTLCDNFVLKGAIGGTLSVRAKTVVLDGTIGGSAFIEAQTIRILPDTRVAGTLRHRGPATVSPAPGAVIDGGIIPLPAPFRNDNLKWRIVTSLLFFISAVIVGMVFLLIAPQVAGRSLLWMELFPGRSFLAGLLAALLVPLVIAFLFVSMLGTPLSLVLTALFAVGVYLGRFTAALWFARLALGQRRASASPLSASLLLLVGLAFFYLSAFLPPLLASAVWVLFTLTGFGGLILACRGTPPILLTPAPSPPDSPPSA